MTRVVVDASALAAIAFGEPEGGAWARRLNGAAVFAPRLLQYELQNVAAGLEYVLIGATARASTALSEPLRTSTSS